eukprot:TRINITY_DN11154_c0_g1_i2.p1 TRINITY_DN11154_c0_g1~~TRINITY_DN11154_c0_g1_i2.p1  ORF type:complete len:168 (-),score=33.64 TRINITY_DN11154_c0_g1_i2:26-529(-)
MSGCGVLEDPALFGGGCATAADRLDVAAEYVSLVRAFGAHPKQVRTHLCDFLDPLVPGVTSLQKLNRQFVSSRGRAELLDTPECVDGEAFRAEVMRFKGGDEALQSLLQGLGRLRATLDELSMLTLPSGVLQNDCLLYTSDAADEEDSGDFGGPRILKKKKNVISIP